MKKIFILLFEKMLTSDCFRGSRLIISVKCVASPVSFVDSLAKELLFPLDLNLAKNHGRNNSAKLH